jgi:hypothetical protein
MLWCSIPLFCTERGFVDGHPINRTDYAGSTVGFVDGHPKPFSTRCDAEAVHGADPYGAEVGEKLL